MDLQQRSQECRLGSLARKRTRRFGEGVTNPEGEGVAKLFAAAVVNAGEGFMDARWIAA